MTWSVEKELRELEYRFTRLNTRVEKVADVVGEAEQAADRARNLQQGGAGCGTIEVTVRESGTPVGSGFTVKMYDNTGPPHVLMGTVPTDGSGKATFSIAGPGTYNFTGSDPLNACLSGSASIVATCTANTLFLDLTGNTSVSGTVRGCVGGIANQPLVGATMTLTDAGSVTVGTATTDAFGNYSIPVTAGGVGFRVQAALAGYNTVTSGAFAITCGTNVTGLDFSLALTLIPFVFHVTECGCVKGGDTVTYNGPVSGSGLTDASGDFAVSLPPGSYVWHASKTNFVTGSNRSFTLGSGTCSGSDTQNLVTVSGRFCGDGFITIPSQVTVGTNAQNFVFNPPDRSTSIVCPLLSVNGGQTIATYQRPSSGGVGGNGRVTVILQVDCSDHGFGSWTYEGDNGAFSGNFGEPTWPSTGTAVDPTNAHTHDAILTPAIDVTVVSP